MKTVMSLAGLALFAASPLSAQELTLRKTLRGHAFQVWSLAFASDAKTLASGSLDRTIKLWNVNTDENSATLNRHDHPVICLAFSPDGKVLAAGTGAASSTENKLWGEIELWDLTSRTRVRTLRSHDWHSYLFESAGIPWTFHSVAFSQDGKTLSAGGGGFADGEVTTWDVATFERTDVFWAKGESKPKTNVHSVAFGPDGKTLAAGGDGWIKVWDVATRKEILTVDDHVNAFALSPDGKILAADAETDLVTKQYGGAPIQMWEEGIRLRDARTGKVTAVLKGHTSRIRSLAFSPDSRTLASATERNKPIIQLWDVATGKCTFSVAVNGGWPVPLAFSPDGTTLASADGNAIQLWDVKSGRKAGNRSN